MEGVSAMRDYKMTVKPAKTRVTTSLILTIPFALLATACGIVSAPVASQSPASAIAASADKISPISAKPGETVQVSGKDFS